jgi:hypothetical protein
MFSIATIGRNEGLRVKLNAAEMVLAIYAALPPSGQIDSNNQCTMPCFETITIYPIYSILPSALPFSTTKHNGGEREGNV